MKIECFIIFAFIPWYGAQEFRSLDYEFYPEINGSLKLHTAIDSFDGAKKTCENEGAILASPINLDLFKRMMDLMRIGFVEPTTIYSGIKTYDELLLSIDGVPLRDTPAEWSYGEPNYTRIKEGDICLLFQPNGTLVTESCNSTRPFICHKKAEKPEENKCGPTAIDKEYTHSESTKRCYKFITDAKTWVDAFLACLEERAYLSTVYTVDKALAIKEIYEKKMLQNETHGNMHLIGFTYFDDMKAWLTIFGQSLGEIALFTEDNEAIPFKGGKPVSEEMACGAIDVMSDKPEVLVVSCEEKLPFICEKSLPDNN